MKLEENRKPSEMLALVCASIANEYNNNWISAPMAELARCEGVRPERISRAKSRVFQAMEKLVASSTRRGRKKETEKDSARVEVLESLLKVSADLNRHAPLYRRDLQDQLVECFKRLKAAHKITSRMFCNFLGLKERTFRSWRKRPVRIPKPVPTPSEKKKKKRHPGETGRFSLFKLIPGLTAQADTTDVELLGVPLKLIAVQDPGDRKRKLLEGFHLDARESAQEVIEVVQGTLAPGTQLATDQGSPFMAEAARLAYEDRQVDHAPQREGTPTDKATLERAFGTLKQAMEPLFALTNHMAAVVPGLKNTQMAQSLGKLLIAIFLRVWFTAANTEPHPLENVPASQLHVIAEQMREDIRKEEKSKKLFLAQIHDMYRMDGSKTSFVRVHRHHALEDIRETEQILRSKACRCQTRCCDRYFTGILQNVAERNIPCRRAQRNEQTQRHDRKKEKDQMDKDRSLLLEHPDRMLSEGMDILSFLWKPALKSLLSTGKAPGRNMLKEAISILAERNPLNWHDQCAAVWTAWKQKHPTFDPQGVEAMGSFIETLKMEQETQNFFPSVDQSIYDIFKNNTPNHRCSPPP